MIEGPVVVDASVVVEYLVRLRHWEAATRLFRSAAEGEGELWAPDLLFLESASALRKLVLRNHLEAAAARKAITWLAQLPLVTTGSAGMLLDLWKLRGNLTPYDAAYVVLARRLSAPLITADDKLRRGVRGRNPRVIHVAEYAE